MASKRKAKAVKPGTKAVEPPPAREAPKGHVGEVIGERKLKQLLAAARSTRNDVTELTGTLNQKIANAVENDHLHKKAFSTIRGLDRMEPEKLAEFMDHFEHYFEVSGLRERRESAQRLEFGAGGDDDQTEDDEADTDRANVRDFPRPASVAAE